MEKRYWYAIRKSCGKLRIYYRLEIVEGISQFYLTDTVEKGNKRVRLERNLMRNNWPIVTKKIYSVPSSYSELSGLEWKEVDEERVISFLRRGNPVDDARSDLFMFFGYSIFDLTNMEREYFTSGFSNIGRLVSFYHAIKKECRNRGTGYTHRMFKGRSIIITPGKIKKAMMILFKADPKEVLYAKN
jgi:hypothetical protein